MIVVSNSSPLIAFAILDQLPLLSHLFTEFYVPEAVHREVTQWNKPFSKKLQKFLADKVKAVQNRLAVMVLSDDLDLGESETIILALENNIADVLMDEHKGREIA